MFDCKLSLLFFSAAAAAAGAQDAPSPAAFAFTHVTVVDTVAGELRKDMTVVVEGGQIRAVGLSSSVRLSDDALTIDGTNRYLIPGLWDMHVHTLFDADVGRSFLPLFVANGVTGVRDMGAPLDVLKTLRAEIRSGLLVAPRIVAAGPIFDGPQPVNPAESLAIGTPEDGRRAVRDHADASLDFIKVYTMLPRDAYFAILDEADKVGLPVAGHVPFAVSAAEASESGQRSIEHLRDEIEPYCTSQNPTPCEPLFASFRRNQTWQTPTLVVLRAKSRFADPYITADPRLRYVLPRLRREWDQMARQKAQQPSPYAEEKKVRFSEELWLVGALHSAQVPILAGTDVGAFYALPGFSIHDELALLVESGLTPLEALRAATSNPSRYFEKDSLGSIEPGKLADLVLLDANPLADIANTVQIRAVVAGGRLFERDVLDAMLSLAEEAAAER